MKFFQTLKLPKPNSSPIEGSHNVGNNNSAGFTWTRLLSPLPSPSTETPSSGSYCYGLSPGTESWSGDSPRSHVERKRPTASFFRSSSYRSDQSEASSSRDPDKPREHGVSLFFSRFLPWRTARANHRCSTYRQFPFPVFPDPNGAIFAANSPRFEDSEDEGLAFEDLRSPDALRVVVVGSGFGKLELLSFSFQRRLVRIADALRACRRALYCSRLCETRLLRHCA